MGLCISLICKNFKFIQVKEFKLNVFMGFGFDIQIVHVNLHPLF